MMENYRVYVGLIQPRPTFKLLGDQYLADNIFNKNNSKPLQNFHGPSHDSELMA